MSVHRLGLVLIKRAQRDTRSIQVYTLRQWGVERAIAYETAIDEAFETLRNHPRLGRLRDDLRLGLLSFPAEHHVIYYRIKPNALVDLLRVLR